MKHTSMGVRLWLYPLNLFTYFLVLVLFGVFITGQADPMDWESESRGALVGFFTMTVPFLLAAVEISELPKLIAEKLND